MNVRPSYIKKNTRNGRDKYRDYKRNLSRNVYNNQDSLSEDDYYEDEPNDRDGE